MPGKVLVTHGAELDAKYGQRAQDVWDGVDALIAADKSRGITTSVEKIEDPNSAAGTDHISAGAGDAEFKAAVDAVATKLEPDYLVLLGGPDVIPHQQLDNPAGDLDPSVPSDLPYACTASYSTDIADFRAPSRVVTRLPDEIGASDPDLFLTILDHASGWTERPVDDYSDYLGVSADVWQQSTALSLTNLFGASTDMQLSPPEGPDWDATLLDRRTHFFNCHGAPFNPFYYGEGGGHKPEAHDASLVEGNLTEGTILSAECCYGAELYPAQNGQLGIAYGYLGSGAYSVFGSTNIAYGPSSGNGSADLICQYFVRSILKGASVGRAGLEARLAFVTAASPLNPMELKALGQFIVLGDGSVQPVEAPPSPQLDAKSVPTVGARRASLRRRAEAVESAIAFCRPSSRHETSPDDVPAPLTQLAEADDVVDVTFATYDVEFGTPFMSKAVLHAAEGETTMHLALGVRDTDDLGVPQYVAVIAVKQGDVITSVRTLYSR